MEAGFEGVDEGMVEFAEYFFFEFDVFDLFEVDDVGLADLFEGEHLFGRREDLFDSAEGTRAQGLGHFVFGDVVGVAVLGKGSFGFGIETFGLEF